MTLLDVLANSPALFLSCIFLFSLLIGSFLNVVIHRLPIMMDAEWRQQSAEMLAAPALGSAAASPPETFAREGENAESRPAYNLITPR